MDRDEYITELKSKNRYCGCSGLRELSALRGKIGNLEEKCNTKEYTDRLIKLKDEYYLSLAISAITDDLTLHLHEEATKSLVRKVDYDELGKFLEFHPEFQGNPIITLNCARCDQQVELLEPNMYPHFTK